MVSVLDDLVSVCRVALTCHFSLDVLCNGDASAARFLAAGALFGFADPCQ